MKLKKLEIVGFKSFVDRTVIKFDHDVTGIVGPNGCGKSNIVDAIRWCMGEQSAKHLRGRAMEDVIFNGSDSRGPHGFAEVTLTFSNEDGLTPVEYRDYPEIAVTRRLTREGDSDYLINKTVVRLKDVTDLFLGTGAGTKAYAIVEQGKIGLIVSAKPEDRRILIEEAAGITKYKSKRKQAERKIELTQQNLLRVGDIITELEKSLQSLKRQAQKADRYLAYRAELDDLVLHDASHKYLGIVAMTKHYAGALADLEVEASEKKTALVTREAELEGLRLAALETEKHLESAQGSHYAAENEVRALESEIARARDQLGTIRARDVDASRELGNVSTEREALAHEQARFADDLNRHRDEQVDAEGALGIEEERLQEATARLQEVERRVLELRRRAAELGAKIASAEAALKGFDRRRADIEARKVKLLGERETLETHQLEHSARAHELRRIVEELRDGRASSKTRREDLETKLSGYRRDVVEVERTLDTNKHDLNRARSRMQALLEIQSRLEGVGTGVRAVIHKRDAGVLGMLADFVEPPPELTQALAAVLGENLQTLVVTDEAKAIELAHWLRDEKKGRATFLPRSGLDGRAVEALAVLPSELTEGETSDALGYLADLMRIREQDAPLVRGVLGDVVVARDFAAAHRVAHVLDDGGVRRPRAIVTLEGEVFFADGRIAAGAREQVGAGMLDSKRETRELSEIVTRLDVVVSELVARHQHLRAAIAETTTGLDAARQAEHKGDIALVNAERDLRQAEQDLERARVRLEHVAGEQEDLAEQLAEAEAEQSGARGDLDGSIEEKGSVDRDVLDAQREYDDEREQLDARRHVVTERKVQLARAKEKTRGLEGALERLSRSANELGERESRLREEILVGARRIGELAGFLFVAKEKLGVAIDEVHLRRDELAAARNAHEAARAAMGVHEAELKTLRHAAEVAEKARVEHEMKVRELAIEMRNLIAAVSEKFRGVELARVVGDYHLREIPDERHRARIHELSGLIDRLGAVNLEAKREHDEAAGRHKSYVDQKADLDKALSDLAKAIEQMDRESKRLFRETFDAVNERFQLLFPKMFRGGKASLVLTNPDDMLETGIEILAQPPGKKIGNIELMSGGEKALTAVSLIFAMFQIRPSPFCILDEVDAPLDEANVARYNEAIRTMTDRSQFILITHIKRTMQLVDVLYGVTMSEPGVSALTSVDLTTVDKKAALPRRTSQAPAVA
jgi:chromosome segregation protein